MRQTAGGVSRLHRPKGERTDGMTTRDIAREVRYITELAERGEGRVVG